MKIISFLLLCSLSLGEPCYSSFAAGRLWATSSSAELGLEWCLYLFAHLWPFESSPGSMWTDFTACDCFESHAWGFCWAIFGPELQCCSVQLPYNCCSGCSEVWYGWLRTAGSCDVFSTSIFVHNLWLEPCPILVDLHFKRCMMYNN